MGNLDLEKFKKSLEEEKGRLEAELASFAVPDARMAGDWDAKFPSGAPLGATASHASQDEQADLREAFESAIAQEQSLESRLAEVNRALERMSQGAFGLCRACRAPIPEERLLANPAAEYDIEHQPR